MGIAGNFVPVFDAPRKNRHILRTHRETYLSALVPRSILPLSQQIFWQGQQLKLQDCCCGQKLRAPLPL